MIYSTISLSTIDPTIRANHKGLVRAANTASEQGLFSAEQLTAFECILKTLKTIEHHDALAKLLPESVQEVYHRTVEKAHTYDEVLSARRFAAGNDSFVEVQGPRRGFPVFK